MSGQSLEPPTRESLSTEYGFRVPEAFATVGRVAFEACCDQNEAFQAFYADICDLYLGPDRRYQQTPPELFPIGGMGVDGVHYGYVFHAPELRRDDYPIGELCPMDSDGVFLVGSDTRTAFENLISTSLSYWLEQEEEFEPEALALYRERVAL